MSNTVTLMLADAIGSAEFREMIQHLGGEIDPNTGTDARLSRGSDHVWMYGPDDLSDGDLEEDTELDAEYERILGGPVIAGVTLEISRSSGSPLLALEIIEFMTVRGWRLVVDNGEDEALTVDQLRERAAHFSSVFWKAPWDWT